MKDLKPTPPKLANQFLRWFLRDELAEEVQGDLEEKFYRLYTSQSPLRAKRNYWYQVFHYIRPFSTRFFTFTSPIYIAMYTNSLKIAYRHLFRHPLYSFIKIGGFALGIAACILIGLFIQHEMSYDQYYSRTDRIFRVLNQDSENKWSLTQAPLAAIIREEVPEVEKVGRLVPFNWNEAGSNQMKVEDAPKSVYEDGFAYADQALIDILEIPMVYGEREKSLSQPKSILISKRKAEKFFPGENPVGKRIILNDQIEEPFTVGGVMENFPSNSHLDIDFFITLTNHEAWEGEQTSWCCNNYNTYVFLQEGAEVVEIEEKLLKILKAYYIPYLETHFDVSTVANANQYARYDLQPIGDIYLNKQRAGDMLDNSDIRYIRWLGIIAGLVLILACINFINLSTAKSANRAKEVGLRKVIGSSRKYLIQHFLVESILYSALSVLLGIIIAQLFLPLFNIISGQSLFIPLFSWWFMGMMLGGILVIGFISGIYPAFYLSAFRPIQVLKGNIGLGSRSAGFRNVLVVFQFSVSILLILGTFTIHQQMEFILNKDLGYEKEQVVIIHGLQTIDEKRAIFKEELIQIPGIANATVTSFLPVSESRRNGVTWRLEGRAQQDEGKYGQMWSGDHQYLATLGINIVEGRNFIKNMSKDSSAIIVNERLAKDFGGKEAIGKWIENQFTEHAYQIIGIMEDFHYESLASPIGRVGLVMSKNGETAVVKVETKQMDGVLTEMEALWNEFKPDQAFRYTFLDERYASMYGEVDQMRKIFAAFASLAIIIACLGLFALSAFMAEQRRKEVSIRKVLGASSQNLFGLLIRNFLFLVVISLVIALPTSWYLMNKMLELFIYRISLGWEIFVGASVLILAITLITVSYESLRTVRANPSESLKAE